MNQRKTPGWPNSSIVPGLVALALVATLLLLGPLLLRPAFVLLGPLGVGLIGYALATSPGPGDGAVLYMLPVLWTTFFFGRRGAALIVVCVAVAHALTLILLPSA